MRYVETGAGRLPVIAVGCMGIARLSKVECAAFVDGAMQNGLNFFDHADIYGGGACESLFGEAVRSLNVAREHMFIQSKCGIVPGKMYDFSKEHIISSVEGSLKRLKTEYLDSLLLHRPDVLMQPEEVAEAFDALERSGKVRYFGVSNMHPYQIELIKSAAGQRLFADQLQFSPAHAGMISCGTEVNMQTEAGVCRDGYILDYCRLHGMVVQAWSPLRYGFFEGIFIDDPKFEKLNEALAKAGKKYGIAKSAAAAAWLLRHPAKIQVVTGTANLAHLLEIAAGAETEITREEWYEIYKAAGHILP